MPARQDPQPERSSSLLTSHRRYVTAALLLLVAGWHVLTLEAGGTWYGDSYQLLLHAENLLEGRPYADTGYVQNPERYPAPVAYPPGYPALLAPLVLLFGVSPVAV